MSAPTAVSPPIVMNSDESPSPFVQPNVSKKKLTPALVYYLDDSEHKFYVNKKAKGSVLIDMVVAQMKLVERDYFGLVFFENDEQKTQHWLYPDKRIEKQLKGLPWEFFFKVKFYPPQPTQLAEDFSRYLLYLQLRKDVYTERLPLGFAAQANLGSLVAQAVLGDYQPIEDYANHLNNAKIAQLKTEQLPFINHVRELHKNHRGLTQQEAELAYLNECKNFAMYGVHIFSAKDNKSKPVQIGVSAHGICVFNDQMRIYRFAWPAIVKISYRRSTFSIRLKAGELDQQSKKEQSISYYLVDFLHAKLLWKCAVEHHGFFRLVQPEPKQKHSFLSFGSARFRYTGRTNIQSQMASQLFETAPVPVDRSKSKSAEMIAQKDHKEHSTPLNFVDELSPQKQINQIQPMATSTAKKERRKDKKAAKDGKKQKKAKSGPTASTSAESSSTSSSSTDEETEAVHILVNDEHRKQSQLEPRQGSNEQQNAGSQPYTLVVDPPHAHTTVETWHEEQIGPEQVTTEVDEEGNMIKRTVRTEQIRHTVQTQSYQQVPVNDDENMSPPIMAQSKKSPPAPPPRSSVLYENGHNNSQQSNGGQNNVMDGGDGELVSTKVVTTGNRTVETLTYKTEKEGVVETRVEHRITIHSNEAIDHDAELSRAILEATSMNPELKVEKVEVDRGGLKK